MEPSKSTGGHFTSQSLEDQRQSDELKNVFELKKSIVNDKRKQFDRLIKGFEQLQKQEITKNPCCESFLYRLSKSPNFLAGLFQCSMKHSNKYYGERLYDFYNTYSLFDHEDTTLLRIAIQENNVEIVQRFVENGANLNDLDSFCCTPLEDAIRCNNLEMVCLLLYYGAYTNNIENNLTSFMFSIICKCSKDIQSILMEYETDYNLCCDGESILFMAIKYHSPLIFDLIERGADPSYAKEGCFIAPFVAIRFNHDVETVRELWRIYDYEVWKEFIWEYTDCPSVFYKYIKIFEGDKGKLLKYMHIFLENEEKLMLDIDQQEINDWPVVETFYSICFDCLQIDEELVQNYVFHLLSYGAAIYSSDLEIMYSLSFNKESEFFDKLVYMDIQENVSTEEHIVTFMYFKYTLVPNLDFFFGELSRFYYNLSTESDLHTIEDAIKKVSDLFALTYDIKHIYQNVFQKHGVILSTLKSAECFPSLIQLSRDASRSALWMMYNVQHISQFYNLIKNLDIPNFIKLLLVYKQKIYRNY